MREIAIDHRQDKQRFPDNATGRHQGDTFRKIHDVVNTGGKVVVDSLGVAGNVTGHVVAGVQNFVARAISSYFKSK